MAGAAAEAVDQGTPWHPMFLLGRCANGAERDKGTRIHAVPSTGWKALCGATYGRHSGGWQVADGRYPSIAPVVTCPRCLAAVAKATGAA